MKRLLAVLLLAAPVAAFAEPPRVWVDYPLGSDFVFGPVDFVATVVSEEEILKVEFWLDGKQVAIVPKEPWRIKIDVGQENVKHHFRVVARTVSGEWPRARSPAVRSGSFVTSSMPEGIEITPSQSAPIPT